MALSYVEYVQESFVDKTYTFSFPYLNPTHITVLVNETEVSFSFLDTYIVELLDVPDIGDVITIKRNTNNTARLVDFNDGAIVSEVSLDLANTQNFFLAQEAVDRADRAMGIVGTAWNGQGLRAANFGDPVAPQDLATKAWSESSGTAFVSSAINSAATATAQATIATTQAGSATTKANTATTQATTATAQATSASASATAATTQASNASASASTAATQASNASASATIATAQATSASTSASNAITARIAAEAALDSFDDRYLGAKESPPTLDNDGNALLVGALYFDIPDQSIYTWGGTEWIRAGASVIETITQDLVYTASEGQTVFSGADDNGVVLLFDTNASLLVYLNGVRLVPVVDYVADNLANTVTLTVGATVGQELSLCSFNYLATTALTANSIVTTPAGTLSSTNVQAALNELATATTALTTTVGTKAPLASPSFTGSPVAPTAATATNNTQVATTAFTRDAIATYAPVTNVASAMAGASVGSVGSYAFLYNTNNAVVAVGTTRAGSTLKYSGAQSNGGLTISTAPAGTWRCMGACAYTAQNDITPAVRTSSLFLRIS